MSVVSKLEQLKAYAQREANRSGKPHAVYNLNPFGSLLVVREYREGGRESIKLVAQPQPNWAEEVQL